MLSKKYHWSDLNDSSEPMFTERIPGNEIIFFDTETTGVGLNDSVVQLVGKKMRFDSTGDLLPVEEFMTFINPERDMPENAVSVHGITNEFLSDKPTWREIAPKVMEFFGKHPVLAAYNIRFDVRMMTNMYANIGAKFEPAYQIDVLKVAKKLIPRNAVQNYKLKTIATYYGVEDGILFHDAFGDVIAMIRCYEKMYEGNGTRNGGENATDCPTIRKMWSDQRRVINILTNKGYVYFNRGEWYSDQIDFNRIDMNAFAVACIKRAGVENLQSLERWIGCA